MGDYLRRAYDEAERVASRGDSNATPTRQGDADLKAENAKLREQVERLFDKTLKLGTENTNLRTQLADVTESMGRVEKRCAKLRELCADMWSEGMCECGSLGKCERCIYDYPRRMHGLGIEVDA